MRLLRKAPSTSQPVDTRPSKPLPDPRSLDELLVRLSTFRIGGYSDAKPAALSAARAAMAGWTNAGPERESLTCATCDACWTLARPEDAWRSEASIAASVERLVSEHAVSCPWRTRQTPATVYRLPVASPSALAAEVLGRARDFAERSSDLAGVRMGRPADLATEEQLEGVRAALQRYLARSTSEAGEMPTVDADAAVLVLALCGWSVPSLPSSPLKRSSSAASLRSLKSGLVLSCALCHRDVCTWLFAADDRAALDPVRSHRPYCPHATSHAEAIASLLKLRTPPLSKYEASTGHRPRGAVRRRTVGLN